MTQLGWDWLSLLPLSQILGALIWLAATRDLRIALWVAWRTAPAMGTVLLPYGLYFVYVAAKAPEGTRFDLVVLTSLAAFLVWHSDRAGHWLVPLGGATGCAGVTVLALLWKVPVLPLLVPVLLTIGGAWTGVQELRRPRRGDQTAGLLE
jgi:hypothetical protein